MSGLLLLPSPLFDPRRRPWGECRDALLRGLDADARRRAIVGGVAGICRSLSVQLVAEGVETAAELSALRALGITLFQGYLFARPGFETLPRVAF